MRKCLRCGTEMVEDWRIRPERGDACYISDGNDGFLRGKERSGQLKAAICPQCGEVSVYVDDPNTVINGWR